MRTKLEYFKAHNLETLTKMINEFAEKNNLEIVSVNMNYDEAIVLFKQTILYMGD